LNHAPIQSQVEYVANTRIGEKGQLTIPKQYRDELGLEAGASVAVLRVGEGLMLIPEHNRFRILCESIASCLSDGSSLPRICSIRYPRRDSVSSLAAILSLQRTWQNAAEKGSLSQRGRVRFFLDSNVLTAGIVSTWGLDKAVLSLCAARICRLVLAEPVREEVEDNLLIPLSGLESGERNRVIDDYARLIVTMPV
jgi:AbrB family looped-hinge helix DNA binding protein